MIYPVIIIGLILAVLIYFYKKVFINLENFVKVKTFFGFIFTLSLYAIILTIIKRYNDFEIYLLFEMIILFFSATLFFTIKKK